jgi:hypothetical protein
MFRLVYYKRLYWLLPMYNACKRLEDRYNHVSNKATDWDN